MKSVMVFMNVVNRLKRRTKRMKEVVILGCAMLTFLMASLHLLLLCGAPLGEYVLGGTNRVIPKPKRKLNVFFLVLFHSWELFILHRPPTYRYI